ncbi:uncharacterized protein LOC130744056 [Lotus japonicus]|uniref:uncharacterized protein LOC130744056 n=1 Tax=Lotus japonicus TaxID=34305 RepID=UPI0025832575|nr:uncharacterized protein LOC130744056 [Lotus japonicus]
MDRGKKIVLSGSEAAVINLGSLRVDPRLGKDRWLVGKLLCKGEFNDRTFRNVFQSLWKSRNGVEVRQIDQNLFTFKFSSVQDSDSVLFSGPWTFNRFSVVLEILDIKIHPSKVPLARLPFWIHVYNLPYACWSEAVAKVLGQSFAGYITWDRKGNRKLGAFFRLKAWVDITIPLRRGQALAAEGEDQIEVYFTYEKLHNYCFRCGFLDHLAKDCTLEVNLEGADSPYGGLRAEDNAWDLENVQRNMNRLAAPPSRERNDNASNATGQKHNSNQSDNVEDDDFDLEQVEEEGDEEFSFMPGSETVAAHDSCPMKGPFDGDNVQKDTDGLVGGSKDHRKRSGSSSSGPELKGTGASPPLKRLNIDDGLGSAATAGQSRPPQ